MAILVFPTPKGLHFHPIMMRTRGRELGRTVRCPICETMLTKGHHCVVDEADRPVNEDRKKSDRPSYCTAIKICTHR